jgi:predicted nucleic acid-binding protein
VYLLDTNIIGYNVYHPENHPTLERNFRATRQQDRWISIITAEEIAWGRLETLLALHEARRDQLVAAYVWLREAFFIIHAYHHRIKEFNEEAYEHLRGMPGDISGNDRLIAAIALTNNFTVVTRNEGHFQSIQQAKPLLRIQNWVDIDYSAENAI